MPKTQWHSAFCAAVRLELRNNKSLKFTNEFSLNEKPLEVDLLVIDNEGYAGIDNPVVCVLLLRQVPDG